MRIILIALLLMSGGCMTKNPIKSPLMNGWHVEYIEGRAVIDNSPAEIGFLVDGQLGGNASCNLFSGSYEFADNTISVGGLAVTQRMCVPALMEQEGRFLKVLERVTNWEVSEQELLYLLDDRGTRLIQASLRQKAG